MTEIKINLPDDVARRASEAGLLSDDAIQQMLIDAIIRQNAGYDLLKVVKEIHESDIAPMSDDEIVAEVRAVRTERRAKCASAKLQ